MPHLTSRPRLAVLALLAACACACALPGAASAAAGKALVFGTNDNGNEGDNAASTLRGLGVEVDRAGALPADLSAYSSIWYIAAYVGMPQAEQARIASYVSGGGSVYLTGERPCCESLNASVESILHSVLSDQDVTVGGLGDISGPFTFNGSVAADVASTPNLLVDFVPHSPGGMAGIGGVASRNVFASNGSIPVGAVWTEHDMTSAKGRVAILMDIDWLNDPDRVPIIENIQNFLDHGALCTNDGHHDGFLWTGPAPTNSPANCSTLTTPAHISWTTGSDAGEVTMEVVPSGLSAACTTTHPGNTTVTCDLSNATEGATLRVVATDPLGQSVRHYRVRPLNDPRNVPVPFAADSKWWDWPDGDEDGIPTHWEQHGVWVKGKFLDLAGRGARADHKDLFLRYDFQQGEELEEGTFDEMRAMFADAPVANPDDDEGISLHVQRGASVPGSIVGEFDLTSGQIQEVTTYSGFASSPEFGGAGVPHIYKWLLNFDSGPGSAIGMAEVKGNYGWTAFPVDAWLAVLNVHATPTEAVNFAEASNAAHELGHQLGLHHHGADALPTNDPDYKSIMSYSYSNFGLPPAFGHLRNRIDYSRVNAVNHDWQMGKSVGKLTLVSGQWGEDPDFYAASNLEEIELADEAPVEPTVEEVVQSASPEALEGFVSDFGLPATVSIPTLDGAEVTVNAGERVRIDLHGVDPAGGSLRYVVDDGLTRGVVAQAPGGIDYTAAAGAAGDDVLAVRALNERFGSEQVSVTVHVVAPAPPSTPGGSGGGAAGGAGSTGSSGPIAGAVPGAAKTLAPRLRSAKLTRLFGRVRGRARLARVTLVSAGATTLLARVLRSPLRPCARKRGCPQPKLVISSRTRLRDGRNVVVLILKTRRVPRGRYRIELTPVGPTGARGAALARSLTVRR